MSKPKNEIYYIDEQCPECNHSMMVIWETPAGDHPELGMWHIECASCEYDKHESLTDRELLEKYRLSWSHAAVL
jgi:hypothetical protein